jgi:alpha-glucosidase
MPPWWQTSVVYQIYPRSFADSDGDGVGDLEGIRQRLDHLEWLGVDAVWLSPIYRSPMADGGYDVSDHCDVDPLFGDLATFDRLLADSHHRGLRGLLDWVPNHTSDQHPWFVESRASRCSAKRNWYFWRDGRDGGPPNNWLAAFGGRAWTWDAGTAQWYLHLFLPEQPDLNWGNPAVEWAMHDVLRFWLDRGVDGFRADVVHLIGKDEALPDQPDGLAGQCLVGVHDHPSTHALLRRIRQVLDSYPGQRAMVGEVNLGSAPLLAPYYGAGDELHMVFNFALLRCAWRAEWWAEAIQASEEAFGAVDAWPVWVLSNHDNPRHRTRYGGSEARARVAGVVLLTLRGTPFLYAGEELGLEDAVVPAAHQVDPAGRDGCRAPIPWSPEPGHGWPGKHPWLPWPPDPGPRSVAALRADPTSILHLYRRLLAARRASPALQAGDWRLLDSPADVLAYERGGEDPRRVVASFGDGHDVDVGGDGTWVIEVATGAEREGTRFDGRLTGPEAVLLRRDQHLDFRQFRRS